MCEVISTSPTILSWIDLLPYTVLCVQTEKPGSDEKIQAFL